MPASKTVLTGGGFQDAEGNPIANGYLIMELSQDSSVSGAGNIAAGISIRIQLDANGNVVGSPPQSVWGNDILLPTNSFYRVTGYTAAGQPSFGPNNQQVTGAAFNLGTWVPNTVISWTPTVGQPVTLENNGVPNSSQTTLNLESTDASIAITDLGGGTINLQAAGSAPAALALGNAQWIPGLSGGTTDMHAVFDTLTSVDSGATIAYNDPTSTTNRAIAITGTRDWLGSNLVYGARNFKFTSAATFAHGADTFSIAAIGLFADLIWNGYPFTLLATTACAAFHIPAGSTTWYAVTGNGAALTDVDTGITFTARHVLEIDYTSTSVVFKIDGAAVATNTTNIPSTSALAMAIVNNRGLGSSTPLFTIEYLNINTATL
jgi:hypothetical protein